jgi:CBS domain containing-hemolysin-like protein
LLSAFFSSAETALTTVNKIKMRTLADEGNKRAKMVLNITDDSGKLLSAILIGNNIVNLSASALTTTIAYELTASVTGPIAAYAVAIATGIITVLILIFGEITPKTLATIHSEKLSLLYAYPIHFIKVAVTPISFIINLLARVIFFILRVDPNAKPEAITEEELRTMVDVSHESGVIEEEEREMIKNVFELKQQTAGEICTHRKEVDFLFEDESEEKWKERIYQTTHSFYPVCGKSVDDIIGLLNAKIYLRLEDKSKENVKQKALSPIVFVSEQTLASEVFLKMQKRREYFAVVVDEYGGTLGIITLHDLIEELVGDLEEKNEKADYQITKLENGEWEIIGIAPMDEVEKALGVTIEGEYETFGGYVCSFLDELPQDSETLRVQTPLFEVRVLQVKSHCICRAIVRVIDEEE